MNILELTGAQISGLKQFTGVSRVFSGKTEAAILSIPQKRILAAETDDLETILKQVGWLPGALISIVRTSQSPMEEDGRVEWKLEGLVDQGMGQRAKFNNLRTFTSLNFPTLADILWQTRTG